MNFIDLLFSFFPHRWLNVDDKSNKHFFGGLGAVLEYVEEFINLVDKETKVNTATYSIPSREEELGISAAFNKSKIPHRAIKLKLDGSWLLDGSKVLSGSYIDVSQGNSLDYKAKELPIELRRTRILSHKRRTDSPITKSELIETLKLYGADVEIKNIPSNYEMILYIRNYENVNDYTFFEITQFVEYVCRAHVGKIWAFPISVENKIDVSTKLTNRTLVKTTEHENSYCIKHRISDFNVMTPSLEVSVTKRKNYWTLDGTCKLDGTKKLNAEVRKEVM